MALQTVLLGLFDLSGVEAAFFTDLQGNCLAREGPSLYQSDALGGLSRRLLNVLQAHEPSLAEANELFLCFTQKNLYARRSAEHLLGLVCLPNTDLSSLRVGTRLALRQLELHLQTAVAPPPASPLAVPPTLAPMIPPESVPVEAAPAPTAALSPPVPASVSAPPPPKIVSPPPAPVAQPKKKTRLGIWD